MSNQHRLSMSSFNQSDAASSVAASNITPDTIVSAFNQPIIDTLTVTAQIKNTYYAGTDDTLLISMGPYNELQTYIEAPRVGQTIHISIDIQRMFGRSSISLSDIRGLTFYQAPVPHPIISDAWELESLLITANDIYTNAMNKIDTWIFNKSPHLRPVWSGIVDFSNWTNSDRRPLDLSAQTYPIRWMPYISDLTRWRCYNPAQLEGVGQLLGVWNGKLIGNQLKGQTSELLAPNSESNSYTWVYTPEGSIIYKRWEHAKPSEYLRHSQLGSGRPVICAGEFRVKEHRMQNVLAMVNDASGHYKPDGGACLRYVAEKFESINIDTSHTEWRWTNARS
ncbi:hypothetical protein [Pseudomonas sp. D3-10]|uniref:hypothetical protein n=1 Tax=unclassified Pseudomonas TaxID=196821 RepID=UPI003DA93B6B